MSCPPGGFPEPDPKAGCVAGGLLAIAIGVGLGILYWGYLYYA